jgi:hypothetical protein
LSHDYIENLCIGDLRQLRCGDCGNDARFDSDVYSLHDDGPVRIGELSYCLVCHGRPLWRCPLCRDEFTVDPLAVATHLRDHDQNGDRGGRS